MMSNLERDLRNMLARRADATTETPGDWQDLTVRMARRNKRSKRMMAVGLVAALLVGPIAGFAVARTVEDTDSGAQVTAGGPGDGSVSTAEGAALRARAMSVGGASFGYPGIGTNLETLFRRATSDGIAIRAYISPVESPSNCQGDGWCPPADCYPDATVTGELSTEAAVGFAGGARYGGEAPDLRVSGAGVFGASGEGSPTRWAVAQAGGDVANVRVSFEGGGTDEMEPVDGVVILAALADVDKAGGTVEALDGSGRVIDEVDLTSVPSIGIVGLNTGFATDLSASATLERVVGVAGETVTSTTVHAGAVAGIAEAPPAFIAPDQGNAERCMPPPPSLPEPGEQPADPAAARAAIEQTFAIAYDGGLGDDEEKRAAVEGSEGLTEVMEAVSNGSFAQQVKDASAKVTEIVFTSPTEAAVRYDINVANYSNFTDRIGKALFIDGRWKVARVTVCADLSLAGGTCPPA